MVELGMTLRIFGYPSPYMCHQILLLCYKTGSVLCKINEETFLGLVVSSF